MIDYAIADESPNAFNIAINTHADYIIRMALRDTDYSIQRSAIRLGLHRNTLSAWMRRLKITKYNDPILQLPRTGGRYTALQFP